MPSCDGPTISGFGLLAIHGVIGPEGVAPDKLHTPHNTIVAVTHEISRLVATGLLNI